MNRRLYGARDTADERAHLLTPDGWGITLHRWRARGSIRRNFPVLLCPGLAASRFSFDVDPEASLANHFADQGFDTWCIELRGHGLSERPAPLGRWSYGWTFDDYLERDLPAALDWFRARLRKAQVHFVGHSMGGVLLLAHLARGGSATIRSGVTVGSSLSYGGTGSGFERVTGLTRIGPYLPAVPFGLFMRTFAPVLGRFENPIDAFNMYRSNIDPAVYRRLAANNWCTLSTGVLVQLATAFEPTGLRSSDGKVCYLDGLASATAPTLVIAGSKDQQCPPEAARRMVNAFSKRCAQLQVFGREAGHRDDYGHFDLVFGRHASQEVWPMLVRWFESHDDLDDGDRNETTAT